MNELMNDVNAVYRFIKRVASVIGLVILVFVIVGFPGSKMFPTDESNRNRTRSSAQVETPVSDTEPGH